MRTLALAVIVALVGCAPVYKNVTHSARSPEGRMCEMQAQRARDYCLRAARCPSREVRNHRCQACWEEYREAFVTCGGRIERVCVENCENAEDVQMENQTQD